jgi:BirA family biotin operon repressor/biotin-[acetyl-CoA-carboxylase] ligase
MSPEKGEPIDLGLPSGTVLGREAWYYHEVGSTNDLCKDLAASGAREGCCVIADSQTAGRGRLGRSWFSPPGLGLYFSLLLRPDLPDESWPLCTLMAGGATARALEEATGAGVKLKWPNDLIIGEEKLGGILSELVTPTPETSLVVIGIGINVATPRDVFPADLDPRPTSLLIATGKNFDRINLLKAILLELDSLYKAFKTEGARAVLQAWQAYASTLGQRVQVETTEGWVEGKAVGLTDKGHLRVRLDKGEEVTIIAGDVIHLRTSPLA